MSEKMTVSLLQMTEVIQMIEKKKSNYYICARLPLITLVLSGRLLWHLNQQPLVIVHSSICDISITHLTTP